MADPFNDKADKSGVGRNTDSWAKNIPYSDSGKKNTRPEREVRPRPVKTPASKPGDSRG